MTKRRAKLPIGEKRIVASEEFEAELAELLEGAVQRGNEDRRKRLGDAPGKPRDAVTADLLADRLREILEDEEVPAYPVHADRLLQGEFDREIQKKALVGLRLETLKQLAQHLLLDDRGGAEELAQRIARAYRYDSEEIARLILEHEEEPREETSHQSRLFQLKRGIDLESAIDHLAPVTNRLIRTGVARWLEVDSVDITLEEALDVKARIRSYRAYIEEGSDGPQLRSTPDENASSVLLREGESYLATSYANAATARSVAKGIAGVIKNETRELKIQRPPAGLALELFDSRTALMLDLIYCRFATIGVTQQNLTIARFLTEKGDGPVQASPEEASEYALKAVRFEGDHVLRSPQACQFIALQHRGLVDVSLRVQVAALARENGDEPWYPVRLTIDRDHLGVMTGFGRARPEMSGYFHDQILDQARESLEKGPGNVEFLNVLAERIQDVATSGEPTALSPETE